MSDDRTRRSRFSESPPEVSLAEGPDRVDQAAQRRKHQALSEVEAAMFREDPDRWMQFAQKHHIWRQENLTDARRLVVQRGGGWEARWVLAEVEGVYVVRSLHLEPESRETPAGGISSNMLRELSPAAASAAGASFELDEIAEMIDRFEADQRPKGPPPTAEVRRAPGRPTVPAAELAVVAETYLVELKDGRGVTRRVASRLGLPEDTARDRIRMARSRGFLTPTQRGRSGGAAGPALVAFRESES